MLFSISLVTCLSGIVSITWATPLDRDITIASWNIEWFGDGVDDCELRGNHKRNKTECTYKHLRNKKHYRRLAEYRDLLNADVITLQEMENMSAVRQIFPAEEWQAFISSRKTSRKWAQLVAVAVRTGIRVERHADYTALDTSSGHLRYGVDLTITPSDGQSFRILAIHLKSGCPNNTSKNRRACRSLWRQDRPLEHWIDARATSGVPFIIAGDWNRHITIPHDQLWQALDDGDPKGLRLRRTTEKKSQCHGVNRPFVDHIVLGGPAVDWFRSFRELHYEERGKQLNKISNHCPISVRLKL